MSAEGLGAGLLAEVDVEGLDEVSIGFFSIREAWV